MLQRTNWFIVQILWQAKALESGHCLGQRQQWRLVLAATATEARTRALQMAADENRAAAQLHLPLYWQPTAITAIIALNNLADGSELYTTYQHTQVQVAAHRLVHDGLADNCLATENGA